MSVRNPNISGIGWAGLGKPWIGKALAPHTPAQQWAGVVRLGTVSPGQASSGSALQALEWSGSASHIVSLRRGKSEVRSSGAWRGETWMDAPGRVADWRSAARHTASLYRGVEVGSRRDESWRGEERLVMEGLHTPRFRSNRERGSVACMGTTGPGKAWLAMIRHGLAVATHTAAFRRGCRVARPGKVRNGELRQCVATPGPEWQVTARHGGVWYGFKPPPASAERKLYGN